MAQPKNTGVDKKDGLDESYGPPEPVAQVRVLPGAPNAEGCCLMARVNTERWLPALRRVLAAPLY